MENLTDEIGQFYVQLVSNVADEQIVYQESPLNFTECDIDGLLVSAKDLFPNLYCPDLDNTALFGNYFDDDA
jgi:hypothetical protein